MPKGKPCDPNKPRAPRKPRTSQQKPATPALLDSRLFLRVKEFSDLTGTPVSSTYALIHTGKIECVRIGNSLRIPVSSIPKAA